MKVITPEMSNSSRQEAGTGAREPCSHHHPGQHTWAPGAEPHPGDSGHWIGKPCSENCHPAKSCSWKTSKQCVLGICTGTRPGPSAPAQGKKRPCSSLGCSPNIPFKPINSTFIQEAIQGVAYTCCMYTLGFP